MVDVDNFKTVNDSYGHQVGDLALKKVSSLLKNLNAQDYISARYGGDEFAVVFFGTSSDKVFLIMEELRSLVEKDTIDDGKNKVKITTSIGISESRLLPEKTDRKGLIGLADVALYKVKEAGRNKVIVENRK